MFLVGTGDVVLKVTTLALARLAVCTRLVRTSITFVLAIPVFVPISAASVLDKVLSACLVLVPYLILPECRDLFDVDTSVKNLVRKLKEIQKQ